MDEKTLEKKDYSIGQEFEVKKNTANANRIGFSNTIFGVGEKGLLMILCDMQFQPHLLYENTFDSDEIQFV